MISLSVTIAAIEKKHIQIRTEDGQTLRIEKPDNDTFIAGLKTNDTLILTLTHDRDILNAILRDTTAKE